MDTFAPTWAVVATVDEPPALVQAFVAWYLDLGAAEVWLYFDRENDPAADLFAGQPQVRVTRCDAAYWAQFGRRPEKHQIRQVRNATDAYGRVCADWLLHCDADEFLWPVDGVGAHLDRVYPWMDGAIVPVAERVFVAGAARTMVFDGMFRRPDKTNAASDPMTLRGLTGHAIGKTFTPVGRNLTLSVHRPKRGDDTLKLEPVPGLELLHFDGLTRLHWVYKLLRKANAFAHQGGMVPSPHRQRQIDAVRDDLDTAFAVYDRLKVLDSAACATLRQKELLFAPSIRPEAHGLTSEAIDDWIRQRGAEVFARFEFPV